MTPLQALENLKTIDIFIDGAIWQYTDTDYEDDIKTLEKVLTPPTADEVCEELERYFYQCVGKANPYIKYQNDLKKFVYVTEECNHEVVGLDRHGYIAFQTTFPHYLVSLIVRFYEAQE